MSAITKAKEVFKRVKSAVSVDLTEKEKELDKQVRDFIKRQKEKGNIIKRIPVALDKELKQIQNEIDTLTAKKTELRNQIIKKVRNEKAEGIYWIGIPYDAAETVSIDVKKLEQKDNALYKKLLRKYKKVKTTSSYYKFQKRKGTGTAR